MMLRELACAVAAALCGTASAQDVVTISLNPIDSVSWAMILTSKVDDLTVTDMAFNRGNCQPQTRLRFPFKLKFGAPDLIGYFLCFPIEIAMQTNLGRQDGSVPASVDAGVSAEKTWDGFYKIIITAREDLVKVDSVMVNRENCTATVTTSPDHSGPQGTLRFGQRMLVVAGCDPIELSVSTSFGIGTFDW